jgi:hypothetical protein
MRLALGKQCTGTLLFYVQPAGRGTTGER